MSYPTKDLSHLPRKHPAHAKPIKHRDISVDGKKISILNTPIEIDPNYPTYDSGMNGLGLFSLNVDLIEMFMQYFEPGSLCAIACTSRTWGFYVTNNERRWKRLAREIFEGDIEFFYTWKNSLIIHHNRRQAQIQGVHYDFVPVKPDLTYAPYFKGVPKEYLKSEYGKWLRLNINIEYMSQVEENIDRRSKLSYDEFIREYEVGSKPLIITDKVKEWPAAKKWNKENFLKEYGDIKFKSGSGIYSTLKNYYSYSETNHDQFPMYLFDKEYAERTDMGDDYDLLEYWDEDLFQLVGEESRVAYKWLVIGTPRTGVKFHSDPRATSAWNALLEGEKRWWLFPPDTMPPGTNLEKGKNYNSPKPIKWFLYDYPKMKEEYGCIECIQRAGEILVIPSGWYHATYNLTESIAVTQNYASTCFFEKVIDHHMKKSSESKFWTRLKVALKKEGRTDLLKKIHAAEKGE